MVDLEFMKRQEERLAKVSPRVRAGYEAEKAAQVMRRVQDHYDESLLYFPSDQIVGCFLQGSQNYGLDIPGSDVDTKLIVVPSFKEVAMNKKPISTTHIRANEEHTDWKDVRLYMQTFHKQNLNFLEILFTDYAVINPIYAKQWSRLVESRERIAHFNPYRSVQSMKGIAMEKFHAMEHEYPSKVAVLEKYGYDPKQLHHLRRVEDYLARYIAGEPYEDCLNPKGFRQELLDIKLGKYDLEEARAIAQASIDHVLLMAEEFYNTHENVEDQEISDLLDDVQYEIMKVAIGRELA